MPTSKDQSRASRMGRRVAKAAVLIVAILAVNALLTFALMPYGTNTQIIWWSYRNTAAGELDTLAVGSSYTMSGFCAADFDEVAGSSSASVATPAQGLEDSADAIEEAIHTHHIRRAVLGLEYSIMNYAPMVQTAATILSAKNQTMDPAYVAANTLRLMTRPNFIDRQWSISCLFPWTYSHVSYTRKAIANNIQNRLECANPIEAGKRYAPDWPYKGQGFFELTGTLKYEDWANEYPPVDKEESSFKDHRWEQLRRLCQVCKDNGVDLYVVVMPQPTFNVLRYGSAYPKNMAKLQEVVEGYGAVFMDFNLARPKTFEATTDIFLDNEHMNAKGAHLFSPLLAQMILDVEDGTSLDGLFYSYEDWDEWLAAQDYIANIGCVGSSANGIIDLELWAYHGSTVEVEYQICTVDEDGSETVVRPYASDDTFSYDAKGQNKVTFKVYARQKGASDPERFVVCEVNC